MKIPQTQAGCISATQSHAGLRIQIQTWLSGGKVAAARLKDCSVLFHQNSPGYICTLCKLESHNLLRKGETSSLGLQHLVQSWIGTVEGGPKSAQPARMVEACRAVCCPRA